MKFQGSHSPQILFVQDLIQILLFFAAFVFSFSVIERARALCRAILRCASSGGGRRKSVEDIMHNRPCRHEPSFAGALGGEVPVRFGWVSAGAAVEQEPTCQPMCGDKTLASGVPLASQCLGTELWRVGWGGKGQTCARPASGPGEWLLASGTQHIGEWDPAQDRFLNLESWG